MWWWPPWCKESLGFASVWNISNCRYLASCWLGSWLSWMPIPLHSQHSHHIQCSHRTGDTLTSPVVWIGFGSILLLRMCRISHQFRRLFWFSCLVRMWLNRNMSWCHVWRHIPWGDAWRIWRGVHTPPWGSWHYPTQIVLHWLGILITLTWEGQHSGTHCCTHKCNNWLT